MRNIEIVLKTSGKVLGSCKTYERDPRHEVDCDGSPRILPFEVEYQLANDLAFLAAAKEGVLGVTAVTVSEGSQKSGMTIRLAANDGIADEIEAAIVNICAELQRRSRKGMSRSMEVSSTVQLIAFHQTYR